MKKVLSMLLALAMLLSLVPLPAQAVIVEEGTCGDDLTWVLDEDGTLTISGTGNMENYGQMPESPFVPLADQISAIVIEAGVGSIGSAAFPYCTNLTEVTIPGSVTAIGVDAFIECGEIGCITFAGNAPSFDEYCFYGTTATVRYPAGNSTWTDDVMQNYGGTITWQVSGTCGADLTWVLDEAGTLTISGTGAMYTYSTAGYNGDPPPYYSYRDDILKVVVEEGVTEVSPYAFSGCSNLTEVFFADTVTTIGLRTFVDCAALKEVTLPAGLITLDDAAFLNCTSLESIDLPAGLTTIGNYAFDECQALSSITLPEGVTDIGIYAFTGCTSLASIDLPTGITAIGNGTFKNCTSLASIDLPAGITTIGNDAFRSCTSLQTITLPKGITSIGASAFRFCTGLAYISFLGDAPSFGSDCFLTTTTTAYYPFGNTTWTEDVLQNYGGTVTWVPEGDCPHSETSIQNDLAATCTEDGCTGDIICDICGETVSSSETIPALGHNYENGACTLCGQQDPDIISGSCGDNVTWTLAGDGTLTISGTGDMYDFSDSNLPTYMDYDASIQRVVIEDGVTKIGAYAFWAITGMTEIVIPGSVTTIGKAAFLYCTGLTELVIPSSVTQIDSWAFQHCESLESIDLPDSLTAIEQYTFSHCYSLTDITIPDSITSIGEDAFWNCTSLQTITIPDSVTSLQSYCFSQCTALTDVTLPESISQIAEGAFWECTSLESIDLPDSITAIGIGAFADCSSLTGIDIPAAVTEIGDLAFRTCTSLSSIAFAGDAPTIAEDAFQDVTVSASYPAYNDTWTDDILQNYGGTITWIPVGDCPHSETSVQNDLAATCIEDGCTGDIICDSCGEILEYGEDIPALGHSYENGACTLCGEEDPGIISGICGDNVTWTLAGDGTLTISGTGDMYDFSDSSLPTYMEHEASIQRVVIEDGVTKIGSYAFWAIESITEIVIPSSITVIGEAAFLYCTGLTELVIPSSVIRIDGWAFQHCESLKSIDLPDSLTSIDQYTFSHCYSLTNITIPDSITGIGDDAFWSCTGLKTITLPDTLTWLGKSAFSECTALTSVTIPDSITNLPSYCFSQCSALTEVTLPESLSQISEGAFWECTSLKTITLPDSITAIDVGAFADCTSLTDILIPEAVTDIGSLAFRSCTSLTSITFVGDAPSIAEDAFQDVTASAYYPADNDSWTDSVMQDYEGTITWTAVGGACKHTKTTIRNLRAAGCTTEGYTGDTVCNICGETVAAGQIIEPKGHSFVGGICSVCGTAASTEGNILRLAGSNRYKTAFLAADQMKEVLGITKFDTVVVASGTDFADALSGSYLAAVKDAPILLACTVGWVNDMVKEYIRENLKTGGTVYILGGTNAIPDSFKTGLGSFQIKRLAGDNRFLTNLEVLKEAGVGDKPILVATGLNFADSLSASATKLPILLVYGDKLLKEQEAFMRSLNGNTLYVIGGENAVSEKLHTQLSTYGGALRLSGKNRFDTSVVIATYFFQDKAPDSAVLAYGWNFPDGLSGGSLAAAMDAPLILTMQNYEESAASYIQGAGIRKGIILGGDTLIPDSSVLMIFQVK